MDWHMDYNFKILTAGKIQPAAGMRCHPKVGRTSVEDDFEFLGRGTKTDYSIVLCLLTII